MNSLMPTDAEIDKEYCVTPVFMFVKRFYIQMNLGTIRTIANYGHDDSTRCDCGQGDTPMGRHHRQADKGHYTCPAYCDCDKVALTTCHYHKASEMEKRYQKYLDEVKEQNA